MSLQVSFGVSTWLWTSPFSTSNARDLFAKISGMGYDMVEIAVEDPQLIDTAIIKEELFRNNLQVAICGAFGSTRDLSSDDVALQKNGLQYIATCLDIAQQLGASFFAGPMYAAVGKARMVAAEQRKTEWERAVKNLRIVSGMAADKGLQLALEPLNRFESDLINNVQDLLQLIKDIDHPAARIGLDGFHMNIEERDATQAIVDAGEKLIHFQVSENYRGTPGSGQTNWNAYLKGLKEINYKGAVSIESFTPDNKELAGAVCIWRKLAEDQDTFAREGLAFLKQWAQG
ncbi:sugar phosphate isomerase/epimerase family protein [Chitinophaga sp. MM2321]|uniref:sugar phosphate isomerase/epimerase family protein n=1 Tax=Chitinophaga sp. MM2321 TaxID=3137178 RepID=UPI0032D567DC